MKLRTLALLTLGCCLTPTTTLYAQINITGKVVNAETGVPVKGANIRVSNSLNGTTTNNSGDFSLKLPEGTHTLRITHVGYEQSRHTASKSEKDILIKLQENYVNMNQVVVTGTGTHRRMDNSPVPIQVITAKDLQQAGITNFEDAMTKLNPNISFMTNGMGTTMSMNGMNEDYVLILENGKRLAGEDRYTRIDMANVKRIEILNGAASALYGSDAIAGVINIITDDARNKVNIASNSRYSTKNRFTQSANADFNLGKFGSYTSYQRQQADGWQLSPLTINKKDELVETNKQASTAFHSNTVNQRFTFDPTDRLSFYARGGFYNHKTDRPIPEGDNTTKYDMRYETYTYGGGAQYMINKSSYLNADYFSDNYSSYKDYFMDDSKAKLNAGDSEMTKRLHHHNLNVKGIFSMGDHNKISAGLEYIKESLTSESDNIDGRSMYTAAIYAQDEINISKHFQAYVGLRYIYHETFKNYATPNIALLYKVGGFNFRGSYASGFRTPDLSALYITSESKTGSTRKYTIGNINLKPEKSDNYTLSAEYVHSRFSISVSAFANNVRDMINYRVFTEEERDAYNRGNGTDYDEVKQRDNIEKARIRGISVSLNSYLGAGFSLNGGYSFTDAKDKSKDMPIDKSVKHPGNLAALWNHRWNNYYLTVNLNCRVQGERYSQNYGYAPKFQLWNLHTTHSFNLGNFILEPGAGVENIFNYKDDRPFNSNYATLTPGCSPYVSLAIRFKQ